MCHNGFMKKFRYLLLPFVFLLTSCGEVTFGVSWGGTTSAGLDRSVSSNNSGKPSHSYTNNTSLDNSGLNVATLTFANMEKAQSDIQDLEKIQSFFVFDKDIMTGIENAHYLGVKANGPLYLGADSTYVDGEITFNFNVPIKNVEITAKQYYFIKTAYNEDALVVDEDVAIAVNDGGFVRVEGQVDEENQTVASTVLGYHLNEEKQSVTIKVGARRAIIEKIVFYY